MKTKLKLILIVAVLIFGATGCINKISTIINGDAPKANIAIDSSQWAVDPVKHGKHKDINIYKKC